MTDIEYPTLASRRIGDTPLLNCQHVRINDNVRLWYVPRGEGNGFDFFVGRFYTCDAEDAPWRDMATDLMTHPDTQVECMFHGIAFFDGVRHLYMGDETEHEGYIFYPDLADLTCALAALTALELQLCWYVREEGK